MKRCCPSRKSTATGHLAAGLVPGLLLLLMPKCPACLAAYLAVGAGLSLSLADAATLRLVLLTISSLALLLTLASFLLHRLHPAKP